MDSLLRKLMPALAVAAVPSFVAVCGATYTVSPGDNACGIAVQCGVDLRDLLNSNPNVSAWNSLQQAQVLNLPSTASCANATSCSNCAAAGPTSTLTKSSAGPGPSMSYGKTYTVVAGDTAFNIAGRFGISLGDLESANPGKVEDWDVLQIGIVLNIPSTKIGTSVSMATSSGVIPSLSTPYVSPSPYPSQTLSQPASSTIASLWTVASGDTGYGIASSANVAFSDISTANPTVVWTELSTGQVLTIPAAPTGLSEVVGAAAVRALHLDEGATTPKNNYTFYAGDGSPAHGWPAVIDWLSFDALFDNLKPYIGQNCVGNVPGNSPAETEQLRDAILDVANQTYVDPRFIMAVVMQESNGCVRVVTTAGGNSNPGLMQSYKGKGTCNVGGQLMSPCPGNVIHQMIVDGTAAPVDDITLVKALNQAVGGGVSDVAQAYYRAARLYNSGTSSMPANGDLGGAPGATLCYSSDIANRLMGWVTGPTACHLTSKAKE
ncbi:hypothetical protein ABEF95_008819 [Exophiala dermatitidis]